MRTLFPFSLSVSLTLSLAFPFAHFLSPSFSLPHFLSLIFSTLLYFLSHLWESYARTSLSLSLSQSVIFSLPLTLIKSGCILAYSSPDLVFMKILKDFEISSTRIKFLEEIGEGCFGRVYKGKFSHLSLPPCLSLLPLLDLYLTSNWPLPFLDLIQHHSDPCLTYSYFIFDPLMSLDYIFARHTTIPAYTQFQINDL